MSLSDRTRALRQLVMPALSAGGYRYSCQMPIQHPFAEGNFVVDVVASKDEFEIPVCLNWQDEKGKTQEQIPFEVICLAEAVKTGRFARAYVAIAGESSRRPDFFTGGGLFAYLKDIDVVRVVGLFDLLARARRGTL